MSTGIKVPTMQSRDWAPSEPHRRIIVADEDRKAVEQIVSTLREDGHTVFAAVRTDDMDDEQASRQKVTELLLWSEELRRSSAVLRQQSARLRLQVEALKLGERLATPRRSDENPIPGFGRSPYPRG
jgi:hypothetical protein